MVWGLVTSITSLRKKKFKLLIYLNHCFLFFIVLCIVSLIHGWTRTCRRRGRRLSLGFRYSGFTYGLMPTDFGRDLLRLAKELFLAFGFQYGPDSWRSVMMVWTSIVIMVLVVLLIIEISWKKLHNILALTKIYYFLYLYKKTFKGCHSPKFNQTPINYL